jgi:hypothetical protein
MKLLLVLSQKEILEDQFGFVLSFGALTLDEKEVIVVKFNNLFRVLVWVIDWVGLFVGICVGEKFLVLFWYCGIGFFSNYLLEFEKIRASNCERPLIGPVT